MGKEYLFTSEAVFEGHPDKVADQISDAILDAHLSLDPKARVACNTMIAKDLVVIAGEITSAARIDYEEVARQKLKEIGYTNHSCGLDGNTCKILFSISEQSTNIAGGIDRESGELGAGDQGMMFGYAIDETPELMPLGIVLVHRLAQKQSELRHSGKFPWLKSDGKTQITIRYSGSKLVSVEKVVFSNHHSDVKEDELKSTVIDEVINRVIPPDLRKNNTLYLVNPAGQFKIGGPRADTGLTGRKIIADTYGGYCPHGGGAFSGKDPTKVDRSAAYMARYMAKNIVAARLASRCTVQLSYAIGEPEPTSLMVDLHGTGQVDESELVGVVCQIFRPTPANIIDSLDLRRPIYQKTAVFGHFGRELPEFTWERTDKAGALMDHFGS
jgi:S-adenosylmethionine synthetase